MFASPVSLLAVVVGGAAGSVARRLILVGMLGGFAALSFTLDIGVLVERDAMAAAMGYLLAPVVLTILGFFAGLRVVRSLVPVSLS